MKTFQDIIEYVKGKYNNALNTITEDHLSSANNVFENLHFTTYDTGNVKELAEENQESKPMKQLAYLKVKYTSLAAESKIIRRYEREYLETARRIEKKYGVTANAFRNTYEGLRDHRKKTVGIEARAAHIAHTFLRGKPYEFCERKIRRDRYYIGHNGSFYTYHWSDKYLWSRVVALVRKYANPDAYKNEHHRRCWEDVEKEVFAWRLKHPQFQTKG